jgi:hypothetical protein
MINEELLIILQTYTNCIIIYILKCDHIQYCKFVSPMYMTMTLPQCQVCVCVCVCVCVWMVGQCLDILHILNGQQNESRETGRRVKHPSSLIYGNLLGITTGI